ncbi:MAG: hypothetical protein E7562_05790 [Ruminococcaceae bacterium]|nr:hypothetical protein [Oscillospiraceae bacterium]
MNLYRFHPFAEAVYFLSVIVFSCMIQDVVWAFVSFVAAFAFCVVLSGAKAFSNFKYLLPVAVLITVTNPLFSHKGKTVLFFLMGNPVTAEAFVYGAVFAITLCGVFLWCKALSRVFTADKYLLLLSKHLPKTALVLSATLRFIPLLSRRAKQVISVRRAMGITSSLSYIDRVKGALNSFSALIGWSLEHAVESSRSMLSRGYGIKKCGHFSDRHFKMCDLLAIMVVLLLDAVLFCGMALDAFTFSFYPLVEFGVVKPLLILSYCAFALLCFIPVIISLSEVLKWHFYKSKI